MNSILKFYSILFCFLILNSSSDLFSQKNNPSFENPRSCAAVEYTKSISEIPKFKQHYENRKGLLKDLFEGANSVTKTANCGNVLTIPVAVHFQEFDNPDYACLKSQAIDAIERLNADFQGVNTDITNWNAASPYFSGLVPGEACIEFCLATQAHPAGFGLANGDEAITVNLTYGDILPTWNGYINIIVRDLVDLLGFSPVGGMGIGDGLVIDNNSFGAIPCNDAIQTGNYNLNRTLTHEMGHYLYLAHIWGDGGCTVDDGIVDTPPADSPNYGCQSLGKQSCNTNDLHMNFMDYSHDACMYMFTPSQVDLMYGYINVVLQNLVDNGQVVCGMQSQSFAVNAKAFLQGPYNANNNTMRDHLRVNDLIPLNNPYFSHPSFSHTGNEQISASVLNVAGSNGIVDWVLLELRASNDPDAVVATRAALIQRDGDIVDVDGISPVSFEEVPAGSFYIGVQHRNHMGIMSKYTLSDDGSGLISLDFTDISQPLFGFNAVQLQGTKAFMWCGNARNDESIIFQGDFNDANEIFFKVLDSEDNINGDVNFEVAEYSDADINMDGKVIYQGLGNDINILFFNVLTHPLNQNNQSNFSISEQLP